VVVPFKNTECQLVNKQKGVMKDNRK